MGLAWAINEARFPQLAPKPLERPKPPGNLKGHCNSTAMARATGYEFYVVPILASDLELNLTTRLAEMNKGGLGAGKFIDNTSPISPTAPLVTVGSGAGFKIASLDLSKTISNVALATNIATVTTSATHGLVAGDVIRISNCSNALFNGTHAVISAPSTTTLTFALTANNVSSAAATGSLFGGEALPLDGSAAPVRILSLNNASPTESETEESYVTYDNEVMAFDVSEATGMGLTWAMAGKVVFGSAGYEMMRILSGEQKVSTGLMLKYARRGPNGFTETTYGFGRFTGFTGEDTANTLIKYSNGIKAYGPFRRDPHVA